MHTAIMNTFNIAVQSAACHEDQPAASQIYLIWSGTTQGESHVIGFARDLADAIATLDKLAPPSTNREDEIRTDWPRKGTVEILRSWFDKESRVARWLRASPTFHALDSKQFNSSQSSASSQF
jgi:hypothetical protein